MIEKVYTAENLTDEQIRAYRKVQEAESISGVQPERIHGWIISDLALQSPSSCAVLMATSFRSQAAPEWIAEARARIAEILNARAAKSGAE